MKRTFVLIHGAWHGGWAWDDVRILLEAKGHRVFNPTLSGLHENSGGETATIGLETHIDDVMTVIEQNELKNIILVGHSYGGMVVTGVVDRAKNRIDHIVYLDAAVPDDGQSMISYGPAISIEELAKKLRIIKMLSSNGQAFDLLPPEAFGIPTSHPRYDWVKARLRPHPMQSWLDPLTLHNKGADGVQRTYIHCVAPVLLQSGFPYVASKAKADAAWNYAELQTGHDAMITAPQEVADLLLAAA